MEFFKEKFSVRHLLIFRGKLPEGFFKAEFHFF